MNDNSHRINNAARCDSKLLMINGTMHRCELYDGHDGNHRCTYEWLEEEAEPRK
ncbi:hypothetical protein K0U27_10435 [archaeon]|nr:hypothetical protein [archaeon]